MYNMPFFIYDLFNQQLITSPFAIPGDISDTKGREISKKVMEAETKQGTERNIQDRHLEKMVKKEATYSVNNV